MIITNFFLVSEEIGEPGENSHCRPGDDRTFSHTTKGLNPAILGFYNRALV